ncbi:MAG: peptidoglycan editing factor PgeF [Bacteroidaceae bacterium]|nr:peptidoglycan editing factor PgeF [Bacteroidaceae bacterium]
MLLPLHPDVTAFATERGGGVSTGEYASMNVCHYNGDAPEAVAENRRRLAERLGIPAANIVLPRQTHSTRVALVDAPPMVNGQWSTVNAVDALITQTPGLCIGVSTADCIPVLLYDPRTRTAAAVHAGWRGTLGRIVRRTVEAMDALCGVRPEDLRAAIGPGISRAAYEVGDELPQAFADAGFPIDQITSRSGGRWHLNLPLANRLELRAAGVPDAHISDCGLCTYTHADRFFSARRQGIRSGRVYTAVVIR